MENTREQGYFYFKLSIKIVVEKVTQKNLN